MIPPAAAAIEGPAPPAVQVVWVETADHDTVALHRYANPGKPAVVLCHGLSSNHRFWDLTPDISLAVALWRAGFDVWNLDLRGHGDAGLAPDGIATGKAPRVWTVDDYGTHDLPAALDHVRAESGDPEPFFVGHSMGGMTLAVYLATHPEPGLQGAVVVGSPLDFRDPDRLMSMLFQVGGTLGGVRVPTPLGASVLSGPLRPAVPLHADALLYNPDSFDRRTEALMLRSVVSPMTSGEITQFARLRSDAVFRSMDGVTDYVSALRETSIPMLFVAGRADHVVNPDRVRAYQDAVGPGDRTWIMVSRANGWSTDYGHLDFGCAPQAPTELFPRIAEWLVAR